MPVPIYQVDAFADELFKGNPAAVVILNKWPKSEVMQEIAAENNLSETAFVVPQGLHLSIKWFTPTIEVDLCGHATLAAAHVLFFHEEFEGDEVVFQSKSGVLTVSHHENDLILDFPVDVYRMVNELPALLQLDPERQVKEVYKGKTDYMFVMADQKQVEEYVPNLDVLSRLDSRGVIITAPGRDVDFVSRYFAPQSGINEDPVTGSAHTMLTPYWTKKLGKDKLIAYQLSTRGGRLTCRQNKNRVLIGGICKTFFSGMLLIDEKL